MRRISWLAEYRLASQEGLCTTEWGIFVVIGLSVRIELHSFITHFSPVPSYLTTRMLDQVVVTKSTSRPSVRFLRISQINIAVPPDLFGSSMSLCRTESLATACRFSSFLQIHFKELFKVFATCWGLRDVGFSSAVKSNVFVDSGNCLVAFDGQDTVVCFGWTMVFQ
jgi:hypothetical protein